jgi:catechol-2,3-dioxygenase
MRVHISLAVKDLESSLTFYEKLFGQAPTKIREDYANFRLDQPSIHLALERTTGSANANPVGPSTTHSHFGIELPNPDTFNAWRERLRGTGVQGRDEHDAVCCYARAEKVWLTDPDQNAWEIWVRTGEAEMMLNEVQAAAKECCVTHSTTSPSSEECCAA